MITVTEYLPDGTLVAEYEIEGDTGIPTPMLPYEVIAVLNVVLGLWTLHDAANAIGRAPEDLIAEAEAWAAAGGSQP